MAVLSDVSDCSITVSQSFATKHWSKVGPGGALTGDMCVNTQNTYTAETHDEELIPTSNSQYSKDISCNY